MRTRISKGAARASNDLRRLTRTIYLGQSTRTHSSCASTANNEAGEGAFTLNTLIAPYINEYWLPSVVVTKKRRVVITWLSHRHSAHFAILYYYIVYLCWFTYIAPSSDHSLLTLILLFKTILRRFKSWIIVLVSPHIHRTEICQILSSVRRDMIEGDRAASRPQCQLMLLLSP